jgi:hypothetical protein
VICALRVSATGALTPHGEPVPLQWRPVHVSTDRDSRGMHVRTFHIDPSGRVLVAANMTTRNVRSGDGIRNVPGGRRCFASAPMGSFSSCASTTPT